MKSFSNLQCSRTCGGRGVMARHMTCIWKETGANAGFACLKFNVQQPKTFKFCSTPKCNLGELLWNKTFTGFHCRRRVEFNFIFLKISSSNSLLDFPKGNALYFSRLSHCHCHCSLLLPINPHDS